MENVTGNFDHHVQPLPSLLQVTIGTALSVILEDTLLYRASVSIPLHIIIPAVVAPIMIIFLCCVLWIVVIISVSHRVGKKKEQKHMTEMKVLKEEVVENLKGGETY